MCFLIFKIIRNRLFNCIISKSLIDTLIDEWYFDKVPNMIHVRVNVWPKRMLSVTSSKKSCMIEVMFSIIELINFFIQFTKGSNTK